MRIVLPTPEGITEALAVLRNGGVVAHATETCYGLACDMQNPEAVARLFRIKKRPETQPVSALFASVEEAKRYVEWNDKAEALAQKYLPGPLTLILPIRSDSAAMIFPTPDSQLPTPTLGVRISSHPLASKLARDFGGPISTTSANLHGQRNPYDSQELLKQYHDMHDVPDLIVDGGSLPETPPSTIIDLTKNAAVVRGSMEGIQTSK